MSFLLDTFSSWKPTVSFLASDQVHEQNNKHVKSVSGTSLAIRQGMSALVWLMEAFLISSWVWRKPRFVRRASEIHENRLKVQENRFNDMVHCWKIFPENPFELNELTIINNTKMVFLIMTSISNWHTWNQ